MKSILRTLIISMLFFFSAMQVWAQGTSNKGTDFWLMYGNHRNGYERESIWQKMSVYLTSDVNTTGTVEIPGISSIPFTVTANSVTIIAIPQEAYIGKTEGKFKKGINIKSLKPIVAYAHIYATSVSGATLVLPTNTLGKEYYSLNFTQKSNELDSYSFCTIVAVEDNTEVKIKPAVDTQGGWSAGIEYTITLNKGEVYQILGKETSRTDVTPNNPKPSWYMTGGDLTGTTIRSVAATGQSCKKIAVFSGSGKISIGCLASNGAPGAADNLFQQVYPTSTWGKSFVTVPSKNRNYDIYRVFKSSPTAVVKLNGVVIPSASFINNFYYEFPSQQTNYTESDNAIQIAQYQVTQGKSIDCRAISGDVGDPEMIFLNPLEQTLDKITMYSTPSFDILRHYINVVIRSNNAASFTIDGVSKGSSFIPVPSLAGYSYAQIEVSSGTHTLQAEGGFNAIAYGFGGNESYGYAAGASLISPGIEVSNEVTNLKKEMGCLGESYGLSVSLPYQPLKITANLDDGVGDRQATLNLTSTFVSNNITYYKYQLFSNILFTVAKKYFIKLYAEKPSADGCGAVDQLELEYVVFKDPEAKFETSSGRICNGVTTTFSDNSLENGGDIVKWHWDFGDGMQEVRTTSVPFTRNYATGTYNVKLVVENQAGCLSQEFTKEVTVYALPVAKFAVPSILCEKQKVGFQDQSSSAKGTIVSWMWSFGDGNTAAIASPEHTYAAFGEYEVKLIVVSEFGCESAFTKRIRINELPTVDFEMPEFCIADGKPTFTNKSTISNGEQLFYIWDFGDGSATTTVENPTHTYANAGSYNVKLTVSTAAGCVSETLSRTFTVFPKMQPAFTTEGVTCAQTDIIFKDQSTIGVGGTISKWFWDMDDGSARLEKLNGQPFNYQYSLPGVYFVKLFLVSSDGCTSRTVERTITVNHLPVADFKLPDFCIADGSAVFINQSTNPSNQQLTYLWDFGDAYANAQRPNTSTDVNGTHNYTRSGIYEVKLTVKSTSGCITIIKKQFTVNGSIPKAVFEVLDQNRLCSNTAVAFKDLATVDFGEITKIEWFFDFANKTTLDLVDEQPDLRSSAAKLYTFKYPTFTNALSKSYTVKMKAYSGGSCVSEQIKVITIYPDAVPAFILDEACLVDGRANFTNLTTYIDPTANLSYLWDFGDNLATVNNPNTSILKTPFHNYSRAGKYNVTLLVTTPFGCETKITKEIVVDGALPVADFSVQNASKLCVQNLINFEDKTVLSFGEITRIDWYYDYANNPTQVEPDFTPGTRTSPKIYTHQYPVFSYPFSKEYVVKMVVYAGNTCVAEIQKTITIYALPEINFVQPLAVCQEVPSITLIASENRNMPGNGVFTGNGVDSRGVFVPAVAGIGQHPIKYTYTSANGCATDKTQIITVNETPVINAGDDKTVLEGGQSTLSATAFGENLTYKWSPSTGLDRDDILNPIVRPTEDMTYTLKVTSASGCFAIDEVNIKFLNNIVIPNAISPNGDSFNDVWNLKYIDSYPSSKVEVFDRTGQRVFSSIGYANPFDGTFKNENLPVGTYYYIITLSTARKPLSGTLTIIR